jgi:hypothetical protein
LPMAELTTLIIKPLLETIRSQNVRIAAQDARIAALVRPTKEQLLLMTD